VDVLILLVFISLILFAGAIVLLLRSVWHGDYDHAERLSLLPLETDEGGTTHTRSSGKNGKGDRHDHALDAR
jgi:hypothetical protein